MVDEIMDQFAVSSRDDGLNFEEWCHWFTSLEGINEMLMTPSQLSQQQKAQKSEQSDQLDPTSLIHITNMTVQEAESQFT